MRLPQLQAVAKLEDLRLPPSNRLESLTGNRSGQWSMRINDQRRVCFRLEAGDAVDDWQADAISQERLPNR